MKSLRTLTALLALVAAGLDARATIILDYSPDTTGAAISPVGGGSWVNNSTGQNFGELISFGTDSFITGMDIFTYAGFATVGKSVVVRTWADLGGTPDSGSVQQFTSTISEVDTVGITSSSIAAHRRAFVDFGANSFLLAANISIWIGISGDNSELGMLGLTGPLAPDDGKVAQFGGTSYLFTPNIGDMALRIHADAVPDSGSMLTLLGAALLGIAALRRRNAA